MLVDEIGGGTEPGAGAALAIAMLERLLAVRACGVVTTHATELKLFASGTPGVANASVRFDPHTFAPTFALDVGAPGQSLAFPLARALGITQDVVERAQALLDSRERDYESALAELSLRSSRAANRSAMRCATQRLAAERERGTLAHERAAFRNRAARPLPIAPRSACSRALREFMAELQRRAAASQASRPKVTASHAALLGKSADELRRDLGAIDRPHEAGGGGRVPTQRSRARSFAYAPTAAWSRITATRCSLRSGR